MPSAPVSPYGPAETSSTPPAAPAQEQQFGAQPLPYGAQQAGQVPPAGQAPYGQVPYGAYQAAPALPKGLSITSMVTGIVGVVFGWVWGIGFLPALAGVIFGHIAQRREPHGKGFWLTGIITGYVGVGIALIWVLIIAALFIVPFVVMGTTGSF